MPKIILLSLLYISLVAKVVYFMPDDGEKALKDIIVSISKAKHNINIATYNFSNKKIAKALKQASKRGVAISIIFDSKALTQKSQIHKLSKLKNIKTYTLRGKKSKDKYGKMHSKYITIDNKKLFFGSINYTKNSFKINHDILYESHKPQLIYQFDINFETMLKLAKKY